jgi:hypothetical protein
MTRGFALVVVVSGVTMFCKAAGVFADRALRTRWMERLGAASSLLPVTTLVSLLTTELFTRDRALPLDERVVGVAAAGVATWLRAPAAISIAVAVLGTALMRTLK